MAWVCQKCNKKWNFPVQSCIFCKSEIKESRTSNFTVKGITKVFIQSTEHKKVPYYDLLLEDSNGDFHIRKTFQKFEIGDTIDDLERNVKIKKIGVVGTGVIGSGIVQVAIESGLDVILKSRTEEALAKSLQKVKNGLLKSLDLEETRKKLSQIHSTTDFKKLDEAEIIIESVVEDMNTKKEIFKCLEKNCSQDTILATNTSSLPINEISSAMREPSRFVGMHFFNPVSVMKLVEIVPTSLTSKETVETVKEFSLKIDKTPVVVKESPGFVVNRILIPMINEAVFVLMEGIATAETIDSTMKLGANHPIGPLALADLIGLDTCLMIMETFYKKFKTPKYKPCPLLQKMVERGHLGRKTGKGFFTYS